MKYLLDTNVISELRKPSAAPNVVAWAAGRPAVDLHISALTVFEIELGIRRIERRDDLQAARLRKWLHEGVLRTFHGRILPLDHRVALRAAELQVPDPRPDRDRFVGATALVADMVMVTRNVKDFIGLGVACVNPWEA